MSLAHGFAIGREQCFQQIDRLIKSHILSGSESLCKLLRYLAEHSLDHPGVALKEYQIATEVLGRSGGFDPENDSTVRVQAGRLRLKLAEYYAHEGHEDAIVVELPKGSYSLTFHVRTPGGQLPAGLTLEKQSSGGAGRGSNRGWAVAVGALAVLLVASLVTSAVLWSGRSRSQAGAKEPVPAVYQIFWSRFVTAPQPPWGIFRNANFVGRPQTHMRYFNASTDTHEAI